MQRDGRTLTAEAVDYPAAAVPDQDGGVGEWLGFMGSVDTGTAALGQQYEAFVQQCPTSKAVLAGYSQGAMVVHRNLAALAGSPNLAAVLLVADGDRRPTTPPSTSARPAASPSAVRASRRIGRSSPMLPARWHRTSGPARSACAISAMPSAITTRTPMTPKRRTRGAWPCTPATPERPVWSGPRRCTPCSGRRLRRPRCSPSFRSA